MTWGVLSCTKDICITALTNKAWATRPRRGKKDAKSQQLRRTIRNMSSGLDRQLHLWTHNSWVCYVYICLCTTRINLSILQHRWGKVCPQGPNSGWEALRNQQLERKSAFFRSGPIGGGGSLSYSEHSYNCMFENSTSWKWSWEGGLRGGIS